MSEARDEDHALWKAGKYKVLNGHRSPETARVIDDYPYGRKLRCKIRYWLEVHPKHGTRFVSQTTNPKSSLPGDQWNAPKASTYSRFGVMVELENGHITWCGFSFYNMDELATWLARHGDGLLPEQVREAEVFVKLAAARKAKEAATDTGSAP